MGQHVALGGLDRGLRGVLVAGSDAGQLRPEILPDGGVQRRERLVEQQHIGLGREGSGQRDTLLLPAGKLTRVFVHLILEMDELQHIPHPRADVAALPSVALQAVCDVFGHGHVGKQRVGLEHHAEVAVALGSSHEILSVLENLSRVGLFEPGDQA